MKNFDYNEFILNIKKITINEFLVQLMNNYNEIIKNCKFDDKATIEMGLPASNYSDEISIFSCIPMIKGKYYDLYFNDDDDLNWEKIFLSLKDYNNFNSTYLKKFIQYLDTYCSIIDFKGTINGYELNEFSLLIKNKKQIESNLITLLSWSTIEINNEKYNIDIFSEKFLETINKEIINYDKKGEIDSLNLKAPYNGLREILKNIKNIKISLEKIEKDNNDNFSKFTYEINQLYDLRKKDNLNNLIHTFTDAIPIIGSRLSLVFESINTIKKISSNKKQINSLN